jgi:hypothetical protein
MSEHSEPVNWLERWSETEPLRLYLYGITVPVLGVAVVYGWMSTEQLGAWLAVAAALFIGSSVAGELARQKVTSPATLEHQLTVQHEVSYTDGVQDALQRTPDLLAAETAQLAAVRPVERCRYIESGRRCVLDAHGKETPHHYG